MVSLSELSVLNEIPAVSSFNDGIDPDVEFSEVGNSLLNALGSGGIAVEVRGLAEEVGTETLVRVVEDSVLVSVAERGGVLDGKLDVPYKLTTLSTLGGSDFLSLSVVDLDGFTDVTWLDSGDTERGSEGFT